MEIRFNCTSCGKCCYGNVPLTLSDALAHAGRFPLALVWTPVPHGAKAYSLATRLGLTLKLGKRTRMAVIIGPSAYIPASFPCPELTEDGLCGIHANKPLRCRTMPFYPYLEESDQGTLRVRREGWECDTSATAPLIYRDGKIADPTDFEQERKALLEQVSVMREYGAFMLKYSPWIVDDLKAVAGRPDGQILTSLSSFFTAIKALDAGDIAARQLPVLKAFAEATDAAPQLGAHHRNYVGWAKEMEYFVKRDSTRTGQRSE